MNESLHGPDARAVARQRRRLAALAQTPWLNEMLAVRMAERLEWIKIDVTSLLQWQPLLGGGDAALRQRYPQARAVWVETEGAAQAVARERLKTPWWQPWKAPQAVLNAPDEIVPGSTQLVWASLALHTAPDPDRLLKLWAQALAPEGFLMCSSLGPDSFKELRALYADEGWGAATPDWVDLHDLGDALLRCGFEDPVMDQERITLTWADAPSLWRDLQAIGGNLAPARFAGLRTPRWQSRWMQAVEQRLRGPDGRIAMTLEFVCGHALKAEPSGPPGESTVSLDSLRQQLSTRRKP